MKIQYFDRNLISLAATAKSLEDYAEVVSAGRAEEANQFLLASESSAVLTIIAVPSGAASEEKKILEKMRRAKGGEPIVVFVKDAAQIIEFQILGATHALSQATGLAPLIALVTQYQKLFADNEAGLTPDSTENSTAFAERLRTDDFYYQMMGAGNAALSDSTVRALVARIATRDAIELSKTRAPEFIEVAYANFDQEAIDQWFGKTIWRHLTEDQIMAIYFAFSQLSSPDRDPDFAAVFLLFFGSRLMLSKKFYTLADTENQLLTVIQLGKVNFSYLIEHEPQLYFHFKKMATDLAAKFAMETDQLILLLSPFAACEAALREAIAIEPNIGELNMVTFMRLLESKSLSEQVLEILMKRAYHLRKITLAAMKHLLEVQANHERFFRPSRQVLNDPEYM